MTIIDSANLMCDKCGKRVNHHVMMWPDGWTKFGNDVHFCDECTKKMDIPSGQYSKGMKLID